MTFPHDIAIVIVAKHPDELVHLFNITFERYQKWLEEMGQKRAGHKTECTLITSRKSMGTVTLRVGKHEITFQLSIRYLEVMIDSRLNFKAQVEHASAKTATVGRTLSRLIPNVGGLKQKRRALLTLVTTSVMTYGIAIWADVLAIQESYKNVASAHGISALRTASAFRTISREAADVIAGLMPIQVLAQERKRIYQRRKTAKKKRGRDQSLRTTKQHSTMAENLGWIKRQHGEVNYYLSHMLSDHGCFRAYLYKFKQEESPECSTCVGILENAEHMLFTCPRFREQRQNLETAVDLKIASDNLTEAMLASQEILNCTVEILNFYALQNFLKLIFLFFVVKLIPHDFFFLG